MHNITYLSGLAPQSEIILCGKLTLMAVTWIPIVSQVWLVERKLAQWHVGYWTWTACLCMKTSCYIWIEICYIII